VKDEDNFNETVFTGHYLGMQQFVIYGCSKMWYFLQNTICTV